MTLRWLLGMLAVPAALSLGCTHAYGIPASHVNAPEASLRAAQQAGAESDPQAALHVHLAQRELAMARALMRSGDGHQADLMLMAAHADAELALSLARKQNALREAQSAVVQLQSLGTSPRGGAAVTAPQPSSPIQPVQQPKPAPRTSP